MTKIVTSGQFRNFAKFESIFKVFFLSKSIKCRKLILADLSTSLRWCTYHMHAYFLTLTPWVNLFFTKSCIVCFISWFQAQKSSPLPDFLPNYLSPILATARMKLCQVGQHLSKWRGKWNDYVEEKSTHKMLKDSGKDAKMVLLNLIPLWKGLLSKIRIITGINFPWTA